MALYKTILFHGLSKNFVNFTSIGLRAYYKTTDPPTVSPPIHQQVFNGPTGQPTTGRSSNDPSTID